MNKTENIRYRRIAVGLFALAAFLVTTLSSCDVSKLSDTVDNFGVVIGLEPINTVSSVLLTDAKTGELINDEVTVSFNGQNGQNVIDIYSDPMPTQTIDGGILSFGLDNTVKPSEGAPAVVELVLEADGYIPVTKRVVITAEGTSDYSFEMVKENDPPASVKKTTVKTSTNSDGSLTEDVEVKSDTNEDGESSVETTIPSGTVFLDDEGNPLTGELTTEVTNFDPGDPESLEAFPFDLELDPEDGAEIGGISLVEVRDVNGNVADSSTVSQSKQKDGTVASHSQMTFTYVLSRYYRAQPGDLVTFVTYSYYYRRSWWGGWYRSYRRNYYNDVEVKDLGNGRVGVQVPVNRWPNGICVYRIIRNPQTSTLTVDRNGRTGTVYGYMSTYGAYYRFRLSESQNSITLRNVSNNRDYWIRVYSPTYYSTNLSYNGQSNIDVQLPAPPQNVIDAKVEVTLSCANPNEKVSVTDIPGASVYYRKNGTNDRWSYARNLKWDFNEDEQALSGGSFEITRVEQDAEYQFIIYFDGKYYRRNLMIDGTNVSYNEVIKEDICG